MTKTLLSGNKNIGTDTPQVPHNILRTVILPNENVDRLKDEIDVLNREIASERAHYERLIESKRQEKSEFEEGLRQRYLGYF